MARDIVLGGIAEWAAANDFGDLLERIGVGDALRHHHRGWLGFGERGGQAGKGFLQAEDQGAVVLDLQRVQPFLDGLAGRVALHPALQRGDAIAGQHFFAIMEGQAVTQGQGPAFAVLLDDGAFDHLRLGVHLGVAAIEGFVDHVGGVTGGGGGGPHRIHRHQIALRHEHQRLGGLREGRFGQSGGRAGGQEAATFHGWFPWSLPGVGPGIRFI